MAVFVGVRVEGEKLKSVVPELHTTAIVPD